MIKHFCDSRFEQTIKFQESRGYNVDSSAYMSDIYENPSEHYAALGHTRALDFHQSGALEYPLSGALEFPSTALTKESPRIKWTNNKGKLISS